MYILFDIGGTKTRVAYSKDGVLCSEPVILKTPTEFNEGIKLIAETARNVANGGKITAAGGGVAGPLGTDRGGITGAPHLSGWNDMPLKDCLSEAFGRVPVYIENDAAIVGLGEALHGAGRGYKHVVYMTVSTGVNGVPITNGKIVESSSGFEMGQIIIDADGTLCSDCRKPGTLENMVSGSSVTLRTGKHPGDISQEDPMWEEIAGWLAIGLNNVIVQWSPEVVVLGGSMILKSPGITIEHVEKHLRESLKIFPQLPDLKKAQCGDVGGIYGALEYIKIKSATEHSSN
jgi:predicted NBD/HSP70 family sugar kinase